MSEGDLLYIEHIKQSISKVRKYMKGMDRDTFLSDEKTQDAVIRQFEVIGEATKRLSHEFRANHSTVPWKLMAGMRDKLIHDYIDVDVFVIWDTAKSDLPSLETVLSTIPTDDK